MRLSGVDCNSSHVFPWIKKSLHQFYAEYRISIQNLANPNDFWDICNNLLSDPYVLFLEIVGHVSPWIKNPHISSMQNSPRNIHTKFGSNWSIGFRGENIFKVITLIMAKKTLKKGNNCYTFFNNMHFRICYM